MCFAAISNSKSKLYGSVQFLFWKPILKPNPTVLINKIIYIIFKVCCFPLLTTLPSISIPLLLLPKLWFLFFHLISPLLFLHLSSPLSCQSHPTATPVVSFFSISSTSPIATPTTSHLHLSHLRCRAFISHRSSSPLSPSTSSRPTMCLHLSYFLPIKAYFEIEPNCS